MRRQLPSGRHPVIVVWDPTDADCQLVGNAIDYAYGECCCWVDSRDRAAVEEALKSHPDIPRIDVCGVGNMSGIFPTGCWTDRCQRHPKILLYELKYLRSVRPPDIEKVRAINSNFFEPLQAIRLETSSAPRWWLDPRALALISLGLECEHCIVIDGFLQEHEWRAIRQELGRINASRQMEAGRRKTTSSLAEDEADVQNCNDRPYKLTMLDDNMAYCGDADPRAPSVGAYDVCCRDALVSALKAGGDCVRPGVAARLARVDLREKCMCTIYRASQLGRYQQHIDSHDAKYRRLTTILYLNENWQPEHDGVNRLFTDEGPLSTNAKLDTAPIANRLILFWAGDECPHEVLNTRKDRWADTAWYADADLLVADMLGHPMGMEQRIAEDYMKIFGHLQTAFPVQPLTFAEAMMRAGIPSEEARRLHAVQSFLAYDRRPPHWMAADDAKSAVAGTDPRINDYLPTVRAADGRLPDTSPDNAHK